MNLRPQSTISCYDQLSQPTITTPKLRKNYLSCSHPKEERRSSCHSCLRVVHRAYLPEEALLQSGLVELGGGHCKEAVL